MYEQGTRAACIPLLSDQPHRHAMRGMMPLPSLLLPAAVQQRDSRCAQRRVRGLEVERHFDLGQLDPGQLHGLGP